MITCTAFLGRNLSFYTGFQRWSIASDKSQAESSTVRDHYSCLCAFCIVYSRSGVREDHTASFFNHNNVEATIRREKLAEDSLEMLIAWLKEGGNVGIHGEINILPCDCS